MNPKDPNIPFLDRHDAGRRLAAALNFLRGDDVVVLALPRGGVPVGYEVARYLNAPLDVVLVAKLGAPGVPALGLGAVVDGEPPQRVLNRLVIEAVQPPEGYLDEEEQRQLERLARQRHAFRHRNPAEPIAGRTVLVVDDGIATGGTVRAALQALANAGAARTVLAVPVAPADVLAQLPLAEADRVCLHAPTNFGAVADHYRGYEPVSEAEAAELIDLAALHLERVPRPAVDVARPAGT